MKQWEIADAFDEIAGLLEVRGGENPFRIRAYRRAALNLRNFTEDLETLAASGSLQNIPGIGPDLANKAQELLATGRLRYLQELRKQIPAGIVLLMNIPGIGPKTAKMLYDRFKIQSIRQLEQLIRQGKIRNVPGLGLKKEENMQRGIELVKSGQERMLLVEAITLGNAVMAELKKEPGVGRISLAGSLRRRKETIRDIDVLVASDKAKKVTQRFVKLGIVAQVQACGDTKASVRTKSGFQIDLRVVPEESFGAALVYFTGSKEHNIKIRGLALKKGLTINEYGVFKVKNNRRVAGREEEEVYKAIGLPWIPPELREDRGEVETALAGKKLPVKVPRKALKGSFHNHSDWSDGAHPIEKVAREIRDQGYQYMVLSDHSRSLRIAGGLSIEKLGRQLKEVARLNQRLAPFRILTGSEVDILPDGRLDFPDKVLAKLDFVIAAVHSAFKQPEAQMTARIVKAVDNPYVSLLAHPTGRLLSRRDAYAVDMEKVCKAACRAGTALEMNCQPDRLDLNDVDAKRARACGAKLSLSTDTHSIRDLDNIELGLSMALRSWVEPRDLINTMGLEELLVWVDKKRKGTRNGR